MAESEKFDKRKCNRRLRRRNHVLVEQDADIFAVAEEVFNIAAMAKDGKQWVTKNAKLIRK